MSDGKIIIETLIDESGVEDGLKSIQNLCEKGSQIALKSIAAISAGITGVLGYSAKVGSEFEAAMSQVQAISQASASDLELLTDKAEQMGSTTKFSATEAADAMSYMAMAGWKTEDMLSGIEGIMSLAAASGEDLATTSDIVTDALTAFGLKAEDSNHFADVLAAASSNANTNVSLLGETFKYVAPVAGALNYSVEDCATAIGLMANSGIKGSQAGTALRSVLNRMVSPTKESAEAMERLGVSITDQDGNMKDFNTILMELRGGFANLSEAEKAELASNLAGQEGMSGLLAIVNASETDFNKLSSAIENCDGMAESMASTMQDNLQGQFTILKSSAEGFGIAVYEQMETPLKDLASRGIEYVNQLTDALKKDGPQGAVEAAGSIIADMVTYVADKAPDIIDASVSVVKSFVEGIKNRKDELLEAANHIVKSLVNGVADLLPKQLSEPIKKVFSDLNKSITSGGLKKGLQSIIDLINNLITSFGKLADRYGPAVVKVLDTLGKHLNVIGPIALSVVSAMITFQKVTPILKGVNTVLGLFGKAIPVTPVTLAVAAIAALAVAVASLPDPYESAKKAASEFTEEQKKAIDKASESIENMDNTAEEMRQTYAGIKQEYGEAYKIAEELAAVVDENGKAYEGYEGQAEELARQLSEITGIDLEYQDGQIQNYSTIMNSLDEILSKKQAEAALDAYSGTNTEAIKQENELWANMKGLMGDVSTTKSELEEANNKLAEAENNLATKANAQNWGGYAAQVEAAKGAVEGLEEKLSTQEKALEDATSAYEMNEQVISDYGKLQEAVASGSVEQMNAAVENLGSGMLRAESASKASLQRQADTYKEKYDSMRQMQAEGLAGITEDQLTSMEQLVLQSQLELQKLTGVMDTGSRDASNAFLGALAETPEQAETLMGNVSASMIAGIVNSDLNGQLTAEAQAGTQAFLSGLDGLDEETKAKMANAVAPMLTELQNAQPEIYAAALEDSNSVLNAIIAALDIHSPSRAVADLFKQVGAGAKVGLEESSADTEGEAGTFASTVLQKMKDELSKGQSSTVQSLQTIITKLKDVLQHSALKDVAQRMANDTWHAIVTAFSSGTSSVSNAASSVCNAAKNAIQTAGMYSAAYQIGCDFGDGLSVGIASKTSQIAQQAAQTVRTAINAAKSEQDSNSPAKETIKLGKDYGEGYVVGIEAKEDEVKTASSRIVASALDSISNSSIVSRLKAGVDGISGRIAESAAAFSMPSLAYAFEGAGSGEVNQTININQPVKSPVETSRELRKVARELAFNR